MRLIDVDAFCKRIQQDADCEGCKKGEMDRCNYCDITDTLMFIKDAAKDDSISIDLVRCKDCKHSKHWYRDKALCFLWDESGVDVFEDGFCNYGKQKETQV